MKNLKRNAILLLIITIVVLFFILKDDFPSIIATLSKVNVGWIFIVLTFAFLYYFFRSLSIYNLLKKYHEDFSFKKILQLMMVMQFFNGVTPFSSGGQPLTVYMLKKDGVKVSTGTNVILQDFILYQLALVTYGVVAIILNLKFHFLNNDSLLKSLVAIGFATNSFIAIALLIISTAKGFTKKALRFLIKTLSKIKIIKNREKTLEKYSNSLDNFYENAKFLKKQKGIFLRSYLYTLLGLTCYYGIPTFILFSMGNFLSINFMEAIVGSAYVFIIASFIPIPGSTGGIEFAFMSIFGNFIGGATLGTELLIWRFITYYLIVIIGAIIFIYISKEGEIKNENRVV